MSTAIPLPLRFRIGARTMFSVRRNLLRVGLSLEDALSGGRMVLPTPDPAADGYLIMSLPIEQVDPVIEENAKFHALVRQRYARRFADLTESFETYLAGFSSKSRSTLRRKGRKFAEHTGGTLDFRTYATPDEMAEFHALARMVSAKTYQEKQLDYGLPGDTDFVGEMRRAAARDQVRGWLLFADGKPVSYLYAPAEGDTLIYAYLGYDPDWRRHSPGTVLLIEALRQLMDEGRFLRFDFTEGDGEQKQRFATGSLDCADLLLLKPGITNYLLTKALGGFDSAVALVKRVRSSS